MTQLPSSRLHVPPPPLHQLWVLSGSFHVQIQQKRPGRNCNLSSWWVSSSWRGLKHSLRDEKQGLHVTVTAWKSLMLRIGIQLLNFHISVSKELRYGAKKVHLKEMADPGISGSSSMVQSTAWIESTVTCLLPPYLRWMQEVIQQPPCTGDKFSYY